MRGKNVLIEITFTIPNMRELSIYQFGRDITEMRSLKKRPHASHMWVNTPKLSNQSEMSFLTPQHIHTFIRF